MPRSLLTAVFLTMLASQGVLGFGKFNIFNKATPPPPAPTPPPSVISGPVISGPVVSGPSGTVSVPQDVKEEATGVLGRIQQLLGALVNPVLATGPLSGAISGLEGLADSALFQRIGTLNIDISKLQLLAEDLGISKDCSPADSRPRSNQPGAIIGPTFTITLSTFNCSLSTELDDPLLLNLTLENGTLDKELSFEKAVACDGPIVSWEKTPFIFRSPYNRAERMRCAECVTSKTFGNSYSVTLYDGGDLLNFASYADFLKAVAANQVLPYFGGALNWRLAKSFTSSVNSAFGSSGQATALINQAISLQRFVGSISELILDRVDAKVNRPLEALLDAALQTKLRGLSRIINLLTPVVRQATPPAKQTTPPGAVISGPAAVISGPVVTPTPTPKPPAAGLQLNKGTPLLSKLDVLKP